jgi:hypothetical protein
VLRESRRPLLESERAELERRARFSVNRDLGGALTFLAVLGVLGATAGSCLGRSIPHALPASLGIALVLGFAAARANVRARWGEKAAYRKDFARGEAEVLEVRDPEVLEQEAGGSEGPTIVMRVSPTQVLVVSGQWLWSGALYGCESETEDDAHVNGAPDPFGFPAQHFEIALAPTSRLVLGIRVLGPYATPRRTLAPGTVPLEALGEVTVLDRDHAAVRNLFTD